MDPTGVTFAIDCSHHQDVLNMTAVRNAGFDLVIARVGQAKGGKYADTKDRRYQTHKTNAINAGLLFSAYWYIGNGRTPAENASMCADWMEDASVPVMLDWEDGSGNGQFLKDTYFAFIARGLNVWLTYGPRWYWQAQGSPNLAGLPPLSSSRYPDNVAGDKFSEYSHVPASYWNGYAGLETLLIQFTSVGRISGYSGNLDMQAFRGSRDELEARMYGFTLELPEGMDMGPQDHEYPASDETQYHHRTIETRSKSAVVGDVWFAISSGYQPIYDLHVFFNGVQAPISMAALGKDTRAVWPVPDGCESISWEYNCAGPSSSVVVYGPR